MLLPLATRVKLTLPVARFCGILAHRGPWIEAPPSLGLVGSSGVQELEHAFVGLFCSMLDHTTARTSSAFNSHAIGAIVCSIKVSLPNLYSICQLSPGRSAYLGAPILRLPAITVPALHILSASGWHRLSECLEFCSLCLWAWACPFPIRALSVMFVLHLHCCTFSMWQWLPCVTLLDASADSKCVIASWARGVI